MSKVNKSELSDNEKIEFINDHINLFHTIRRPKDLNLWVDESKIDYLNISQITKKAQSFSLPLSILMHAFHPDILLKMNPYLSNLSLLGLNFFINFSSPQFDRATAINHLKEFTLQTNKINYILSDNFGRDWGGLYRIWLSSRTILDKYILIAHTKKSLHLSNRMASYWRSNLLSPLVGSQEIIKKNIHTFEKDDSTGIIASNYTRVHTNSDKVEKLYQINTEFSAGSMFFIRKDILSNFFETLEPEMKQALLTECFKPSDYTPAHWCERAVFAKCIDKGYVIKWII